MSREIEIDKSYFGARRETSNKTPMFLLRATCLVTVSKRFVKTKSHEFILNL